MKGKVWFFEIIIIMIAAVILGSFSATAQEVVVENDTGIGARAMGMGGAQIAAVNDVTAVIHNPAALAQLKNTEVQLGLNLLKRDIKSSVKSSLGTNSATGNTDYSGLGTFGLAYPVPTDRGSLVLAVGYNRVKDFAGRVEFDGYNDGLMGIQSGEAIDEGGLDIISLAGALDISPNVSVGVSLDIWFGSYRFDNRALLNDTSEPYSQLDFTGSEDDISAWSLKPGILYHKDNFRFGAYARLPMTFHVKEHYYSEGYSRGDGEFFRLHEVIDPYSAFTDDDYTYTDNLDYKIEAPMQMGFGTAWGTPGESCFAFDVVYENWTQAKLKYPSDYYQEPNYFRDKYRSALNWRVGYERGLPFSDAVGRIGYSRQPLTFKGPRSDNAGEPLISVDNERDFVTVGFGKKFDETLMLDVAFAVGLWSQKEEPRETEENRSRVYVTLTYLMPNEF